MQEKLRALPRSEFLFDFMEKLLAAKKDTLRAAVLFGSMAKMEYTNFSDYDLFIVVESDFSRFIDRPLEFTRLTRGYVEPFVYTREEVELMMRDYHPLLLDALKDGVVLHDDGFWKGLKVKFEELIQRGVIIPKKSGWTITVPS